MVFPKKCEHNKTKYTCIECGGKGICVHKKNKQYCKECKGSAICPHGKDKYGCITCYEIKSEKDKNKILVPKRIRLPI